MGDNPKLMTVCCPTHHDVMINGLWNFWNTKQGLDFDFQWGGRSILAHKLVVDVFLSPEKLVERQRDNRKSYVEKSGIDPITGCASDSPHFDSATEKTDAESGANQLQRENKTKNYDQEDADDANLGLLLEFLYKGKVAVSEKQLDGLLGIAKDLDFKMLMDAVEATKKTVMRRATQRRQRKGNPSKLVHYKETSEAESNDEEWNSPPPKKSRVRLTKGRKKIYETLSSEEEEEEDDEEEEQEFIPESDKSESEKSAAQSEDEETENEDQVEDPNPPPPPPIPKKTPGRRKVGSGMRKPRKPRQKKSASAADAGSGGLNKIDRRTLWRQSQPLLKCEHCNYESRHKSRFEIHRAKHDPNIVVFRCETCSRAFVSDDQLETHKIQAHGNGASVGIHQCPQCEYKTRDKGWFQVHLAKHDPTVVVFRCETCGNPYSSQESLDRHKVTQHGDVAKTYKCGRCAFETEVKTKYYQHLYSTHKVNGYGEPMKERYKCPECEYTCSFRSALKKHNKTHVPDKAFKCEQCDYASSHQGHVYRHVRTAHLHIKPYICEICGHRSATRCHLDRHLQTHTQEKPFKCDVCGQCYADRRYLNDHLRSHVSNEKTYICHICGHASSRREYLNAHLKAVHRAPSETKRARQLAAGTAAANQLSVETTAGPSIPTHTLVASSSLGGPSPMTASLQAGLPVSGVMGEGQMMSLQHLGFHNFVCL